MPLTPKESSSTTRPADVSPNASTQGYFRDDCATLVTYEWLNELVADKVNALNDLSVAVVPNDDNATKKMHTALRTGQFDYDVGNLTVNGVSAVDASLFTTGTLDNARLNETITSDTTGNAATATNASNLGGELPSYYTNADNLNAGKIPAARLTGQDYIVNSFTASGGKIGLSGDGTQDYLQFTDSDNYLRGYENGVPGRINTHFRTGDFENLDASNQITVAGVSVRNAAVLTSGKLNNARLESTITSNTTGNAATATQASNADTVDGYHASAFALVSDLSWSPNFITGDGQSITTNGDITSSAHRIGNIVFCRWEGRLNPAPNNTTAASFNLPASAASIQNCGLCWALYTSDPDGSIEDLNADDWGTLVVRGSRAYFKNNNYDVLGSQLMDNGYHVLTFSYMV